MNPPIYGQLTNAGTMIVGHEEGRTGLFIALEPEDLAAIKHLPMYRKVAVTPVVPYEPAPGAKPHTRTPWAVYRRPYTVHTGGTYEELSIGTAWDCPQLKGPYPVITLACSVTPDGKGQWTIHLSEEDAAFIVEACNNHERLTKIEALRAEDKRAFNALQDDRNAWQSRAEALSAQQPKREPITPTEALIELAVDVAATCVSQSKKAAALLIAEAMEKEKTHSATMTDLWNRKAVECDQLRAEVERLKSERAQVWAALNFRPEASLEIVLGDARLLRPEMAKARQRVQELEGRADWDQLWLDGAPEMLKRVWQRMRATERRAEKAEAELAAEREKVRVLRAQRDRLINAGLLVADHAEQATSRFADDAPNKQSAVEAFRALHREIAATEQPKPEGAS